MKCPNCNKEIADNTKFCPECGSNIKSSQSSNSQNVTPQQTATPQGGAPQQHAAFQQGAVPQQQNQPMYNQYNNEPPKKKLSLGKKVLIIVASVLVFFFVIGSCNSNETTTPTNTTPTNNSSSESNTTASTPSKDMTKPINIYNYLSENYTAVEFTVSDKAKAFLAANPNIFPAKAYVDCENLINWSIGYKHLAKNAANYGDKLIQINGKIVQISELATADTGLSDVISVINMSDYEGNQYIVFYYGTQDIYIDDTISITGLPLDMSSFDNTKGGQTLCPVIAGSYIEKQNY